MSCLSGIAIKLQEGDYDAEPDQDPSAGRHILNSQETDFINLVDEINQLTGVPAKMRTLEQQKRLRNIKNKYKKIENNFLHLVTVKKPKAKTDAERKVAQRAKEDDEAR